MFTKKRCYVQYIQNRNRNLNFENINLVDSKFIHFLFKIILTSNMLIKDIHSS